MMTGRNAIFGIGKPTEMIGSKNQRTMLAARHQRAEHDAADGGNEKADHRPIERQPEIDPQIAADRIVLDALERRR